MFLRIALKQLVKHFDVWINKLLFLSIFSEAPLDQRTARYILGRRYPELQIISEYASTINNRTINLQEYSTLLAQRCNSRVHILTSYHVQPRMHDLRQISDGGNMWSTSPCHQLLILRRQYFTNYAALASNSHLAESNVKDANHCSIIGRGEATATLFSTTRSGIVETLNANSKKHKEEKTKRKTRDGTAGNAENQIKTRVSGSTRSEKAIMLLKKRHESIETDLRLQDNEREWKRLR